MTKLALLALALSITMAAQSELVPRTLPPKATTALATSLDAAKPHAAHVWRDTPPVNEDGTINGYVEIARGDRRKFEFDIKANRLALDRMIAEDIGGYPINYGFVPQTVSYDGDPFDVLVLGPPLANGQLVRGVPVGLMYMEDEKGFDSKVVVAPIVNGKPSDYRLTESIQREVGGFFARYRKYEPNGFSRVPGWGTASDGIALVRLSHAFFNQCRGRAGAPCSIAP